MNPSQQLYEDTLKKVQDQFQLARTLSQDARMEWYQEVKKLLQHEMDAADFPVYDSDGF